MNIDLDYQGSTEATVHSDRDTVQPDRNHVPQGRERRATLRALSAWVSARENDGIPDLNDLAEKAVKAGKQEVFTDNQFLIMADPYTENSVVIYYGNALPKVLGRRNVGKNVQSFLPDALKDIFLEACKEAAYSDNEVYRQGEITTVSCEGVLYRSVFMPLRSDSQNKHIYIFGAFSNETGATKLLAA